MENNPKTENIMDPSERPFSTADIPIRISDRQRSVADIPARASERTRRPSDAPSRPAERPVRPSRPAPRPRAKKVVLWITSLFLVLTLSLSLFTCVLPDKSFSESENRGLRQRPKLTFSSLMDGSWFEDVPAYFADQFAGRDLFMELDLLRKQAGGSRENGGVYLGKHDQLYLIPETPNWESLNRNLAAVNGFAARHDKLRHYMCVVPNAVTVQPGNLPKNAPVPDQVAFLGQIASSLQGVTFADVTPALTAHTEEYIFYFTDHHWTTLGAKYAFDSLAATMGIDAVFGSYRSETVSTTFEGTLASKSGRHAFRDTVEIAVPETEILYNVTYTDTMRKTGSIFEPDALSGKDAYTVFFGGNHPRVDINSTAETGRKLLLFKDSYANCLMQFLWPYFDEIVMVDPRYCYESADDIVRQEGITDVLYLYNADTFGTDNSLYAVLGE